MAKSNENTNQNTRNVDDEVAFKADTPARDRDDVQIGDGETLTRVRDDNVAVDEQVRDGLGNAVTNTQAQPGDAA